MPTLCSLVLAAQTGPKSYKAQRVDKKNRKKVRNGANHMKKKLKIYIYFAESSKLNETSVYCFLL